MLLDVSLAASLALECGDDSIEREEKAVDMRVDLCFEPHYSLEIWVLT